MILPFRKTSRRRGHSGFTLLEVLISFALAAMVMGTVIITLSQASTSQKLRLRELWSIEFAHSKLAEWGVGGVAATDIEGKTLEGWNWRISETLVTPDPPSTLSAAMRYYEIKVIVWNSTQPDQSTELTTIVARRAK